MYIVDMWITWNKWSKHQWDTFISEMSDFNPLLRIPMLKSLCLVNIYSNNENRMVSFRHMQLIYFVCKDWYRAHPCSFFTHTFFTFSKCSNKSNLKFTHTELKEYTIRNVCTKHMWMLFWLHALNDNHFCVVLSKRDMWVYLYLNTMSVDYSILYNIMLIS